MKTIKFYKLSERKPLDEQEIWYIHNSPLYSAYEFKYGTVEYSYKELDDEGNYTGTSFLETFPPEDVKCHLMYLFEGCSMSDNDLWAPVEEIEEGLFGEDEIKSIV